MKILAISGSGRRTSTNTALLRALQALTPDDIALDVFHRVDMLPVFSPDLLDVGMPATVRAFVQQIAAADGLIISSPEYVRGIPGGLKNALDWLVAGEEVIDKPIALVHASHRGDDMLDALRLVLTTLSSRFNPNLFLRVPLMKETPEHIAKILVEAPHRAQAERFLQDFFAFCRHGGS